jgi:hypothetical protein
MLSKELLEYEYVINKKSTYQIAEEHNTYANMVRRLLLKYGISLRSKAEAQSIAIKNSRHAHPTKDVGHSEETIDKIKRKINERRGKKS